jgi:hypothetical protein
LVARFCYRHEPRAAIARPGGGPGLSAGPEQDRVDEEKLGGLADRDEVGVFRKRDDMSAAEGPDGFPVVDRLQNLRQENESIIQGPTVSALFWSRRS